MMYCFHYVIPLFLLIPTTLAYDNSYIIVCPDTIRPGMEFTVKFSKLDSKPRLRLNADILTSTNTIVSDSTIVSASDRNAILTLIIPRDIHEASYVLEVKAVDESDNGVLFKNTTSLMYMQKHMSIFIQTDKAMYKPGQTVQFRALATNPDLSILYGPMDISVYDPNNNKIAQWLNVQKPSGVYQGSLKLSDQPPLGTWKIEVDFGATSKTQEITVAEYVLPKFEVKVILSSFGLTSDTYLSGKVEARYTFDKGVEGNGTLTITRQYNDNVYTTPFMINGVYKFDIPLTTLTNLFGNMKYNPLTVTAVVEEGLTTIARDDSNDITYYDTEEKLVFMDGPDNFKPGLRYAAYLYVSDQDDKPLSKPGSVVNITVTKNNGAINLRPDMKSFNVPINGIIAYDFPIPSNIETVSIKANTEHNSMYKYLTKFQSVSEAFIQVTVKTRNPQTGNRCAFKLRSTKKKITVNYMILAKSLILEQGQIKMKRKTKTLKVMLTSAMSPSAKCVVYWVSQDAEVIADSIEFNVKRNFDNKVNVDFVKPNGRLATSSKPGKTINVRVRADAGSQCNVLTVDKSVLLLKSGNDITSGKIEEEMNTYESKPTPCAFDFICLRSFYPVPIQGVDVAAIFENSGLKVLTDAFLYKYQPPYRKYMAMEMPVMMEEFADIASSSVPNQRVRSFFPETWLYESSVADSNGAALIQTVVPDTVTTWISSAFAVNEVSGLGVTLDTAELRAFLNFFVRLDLPYSVIRSEQVIIQANVFNFFTEDLEVEVTLKESVYFQAILVAPISRGPVRLVYRNQEVVHIVQVPAGTGVAVNFPIVPTEIGNIDIEISAVSSLAGDAVRKQLLVEAEGIEESYNIPVLINLNEESSHTTRDITVPDDVVAGSVRIQISAIGDLMGPSISGLTNLLKMPYGCGEQNMINFVPNIVVIKYLDAVNNLKPADESKAKGFMLVGYQKELTYQHNDGSFSAFGNSDSSGSTWLTAFVVKSFAQAQPYIFIDPVMMKQSIEWLLNRYVTSGTFLEPGNVIHKEMQGGSASGKRNLATYTLIALKEARSAGFAGTVASLDQVIGSATGVLETAVTSMEDIYELAISSYALALSGSSVLADVLLKLESKATTEDGLKFWAVYEESETNNPLWKPPYIQARAQNIETTAYVLLTYSVQGNISAGLPVLKWLAKQRNSYGGFGSTQDTVVALQALAEFGALIFSDNFSMDMNVDDLAAQFSHSFSITPANALLYQTVQVPETSRKMDIAANGSGMALVEIAVSYNVMADPVDPLFDLRLSYTDETVNGFKLKVCFRWLGNGTSGMSVLEIKLLSGFSAEKFTITQLSIMKRVEDGDKALVLYLDQVPSDRSYCINVRMQRQDLVAGTQPAVVKIFDYYDPDNHAYSMYQPTLLRDTNICDLNDKLGC